MNAELRYTLVVLALWSGAAFAASGPARDIHIDVQPCWGTEPLALGQEQGRDAAGAKIVVSRLDLILSHAALRREDGSWLESKDWFACIRADQGRSRALLEGVPGTKFTALRFDVGLDAATDVSDPNTRAADHPLHPLVNGLHWGWAGSYIFLAMEGRWQKADGAFGGWSYHIANDWNLMHVELPIDLAESGVGTIRVALDLARVFRDIDIAKDGDSTHSREGDAFATRLKGNIEQAFRVKSFSSDRFHDLAITLKSRQDGGVPFHLDVTARFPVPAIPADNVPSVEGVALGGKLFHDRRLSKTNTQSCADCHDRTVAFADPGKRFSVGAEGQIGKRNAMPLFNLLWQQEFFWDGRAVGLRNQVLMPIQDAHEMNESLDGVVAKLSADRSMRQQFSRVFGDAEITGGRIGLALEQYLHTLISQDSKFDRALRKETKLTESEARGLQLFVTEHDPKRGVRGADCFHCHGGMLMTDRAFHNNGLALAAGDIGREAVTKSPADRGKFKTPSLRNIALTAPYMHDGRFATLEEVIEHYDHGVTRGDTLDPNLAKHPAEGLGLTAQEKADLASFLRSLTDTAFTSPDKNLSQTNPR